MAATVTNQPKFFKNFHMETTWTCKESGRWTMAARCGCQIHGRNVTEGELAGMSYQDSKYDICDEHCQTCPTCNNQVWPHMDCNCPEE